jgi:hypothetical protein
VVEAVAPDCSIAVKLVVFAERCVSDVDVAAFER